MPFCYEQTSPLGVPLYAFGYPQTGCAPFGFSLSVLHLFFLSPKTKGAVVKQPPSFERKLNEKIPKKSKNVTAAPHLIF